MSASWFEDVKAFHKKFGAYTGERPETPPMDVEALRDKLIDEEAYELKEAIGQRDLPDIAKEGIDLIVVVLGMFAAYGIDPRPVWDLVHDSNMAKEGGGTRSDGKIMKPTGWKKPDIQGEIFGQQGKYSVKTFLRDDGDTGL